MNNTAQKERKRMMIRLVALDLDDTLLRPDLTISPLCRQALQETAARGVKITIASGRMYRATQIGRAHV